MADLADRDAGDRLVEDAWNVWGGLDAWLHFAGADILTGPARSFDFDAKLDLLLAVDVVSTLRLCRVVGRRMKDQGGGTIVTIGWDQAETGMEGDSGELFAATKGAVLAFTRSLALSLAPAVRVNAIVPGWIRTDWGDDLRRKFGRIGCYEKRRWDAGVRRRTSPTPPASSSAPGAAFVTGQVLRVNGGAIR